MRVTIDGQTREIVEGTTLRDVSGGASALLNNMPSDLNVVLREGDDVQTKHPEDPIKRQPRHH